VVAASDDRQRSREPAKLRGVQRVTVIGDSLSIGDGALVRRFCRAQFAARSLQPRLDAGAHFDQVAQGADGCCRKKQVLRGAACGLAKAGKDCSDHGLAFGKRDPPLR